MAPIPGCRRPPLSRASPCPRLACPSNCIARTGSTGRRQMGIGVPPEEDPPRSLFSSRAPSTNPRLRAFAPLCPQPWTSVALTYLREMDIIATRRSEAASSSKSAAANAAEEPRPNPKRKPKFPKKPKEKEGS